MEQAVAVAAESQPDRGFFAHLGGVLFSPSAEFKAIVSRPRFWVPLLAGLVITIAFTSVWISKVDVREFMQNQMQGSARLERMTPEQRERMMEIQVKTFKPLGLAGAAIGSVVFIVVIALVYLVVFRFMYGAEVTFSQAMAVVAWTFLAIGVVTVPLLLIVYFMKGDWNLAPDAVLQANLALLFDKQHTAKPLYALASSLDLFEAWRLWLLAAGFGAAMKKTGAAALPGVLGLWAVYVLGKVALSFLF